MNKEIENILHKHCSGSIDDDGNCFIPSRNFSDLKKELGLSIEKNLKEFGGWTLSACQVIGNLFN